MKTRINRRLHLNTHLWKATFAKGSVSKIHIRYIRKPWRDIFTYYLSIIIYYLLLTTYHLLLTTYYLLLITFHIIYHPYNDGKLHCTFPVIAVEYGSPYILLVSISSSSSGSRKNVVVVVVEK